MVETTAWRGHGSRRMRPRSRSYMVLGAGSLAVFIAAFADSYIPLAIFFAVPLAVFLFAHPRLVVVLLMVVWAGPIDQMLLQRSVGGLRVSAGLLLLAIGLAWVVASRLTGRGPRREHAGFSYMGPFALFYLALGLSMIMAISSGESRGAVVNAGLSCVGGLAYFIARDAYAGEPRVLARHMVITTGVCAAIVVLGVATGLDVLYGRQIGYVLTGGLARETVRIDPPLLRLLSVTILMLGPGKVLASGRWRKWRMPLLCAMVLAEVLSLTRSTWAPLIVATVLIPAIAVRRQRLVILGRYLSVMTLALVLGATAAAGGLFGDQGRVAAERLYSATQASALRDSSLEDRLKENEAALDTISEHPIMGIGITRGFGILGSIPDPIDEGSRLYGPQRFIHQSYLGLWMWFGLPGIAAILWLVAVLVQMGRGVLSVRGCSRHAPVAALAGLMVLGISSTFQTNLMYSPAHLALGLGLAYVETWWRRFHVGVVPMGRDPRVSLFGCHIGGGSADGSLPPRLHSNSSLKGRS